MTYVMKCYYYPKNKTFYGMANGTKVSVSLQMLATLLCTARCPYAFTVIVVTVSL